MPGTIDAIVTLLKLYGTKSFEDVVQPTLAILDAGGPTSYRDTGSGQIIETGTTSYRLAHTRRQRSAS